MEKSFIKGMYDAPRRYQDKIKNEIETRLRIDSQLSWSRLLYGRLATRPTLAEREAIEKIFRSYGVWQPWGRS